jgi:hypothetical protein
MQWTDVFVGAVSVAIGLWALGSSIFNWESAYRLAKARWFEKRYGRRGARTFYAVLGILMLVLGVAIAAGFGPNRLDREQTNLRPVESIHLSG